MERVKFTLTADRSRVKHIIDISPDGWVVEVREPSRTKDQNALYWATLHDLSENVKIDGKQYLATVWHKYFKERFLPGRIIELPYGHIVEAEPSTADLTKEQFSEFIEQVMAFYHSNREE